MNDKPREFYIWYESGWGWAWRYAERGGASSPRFYKTPSAARGAARRYYCVEIAQPWYDVSGRTDEERVAILQRFRAEEGMRHTADSGEPAN